jgi:hypothetical protein
MPPDPNIPNDQILWHQSGVNAKGEAFVQLLRGTEITLDQAHEQSGLPRAWLLAQARAGAPWAINCGTGKKEFWRFRA